MRKAFAESRFRSNFDNLRADLNVLKKRLNPAIDLKKQSIQPAGTAFASDWFWGPAPPTGCVIQPKWAAATTATICLKARSVSLTDKEVCQGGRTHPVNSGVVGRTHRFSEKAM
jgi:hypothetical protein